MAKFTVKTASPEYIREIANRYLSEDWITFEHLARDYDISPDSISKLLYRGIAENILSDSIADKVFNKVVYANEKGVKQRLLRWEKAFDERDNLKSLKKKESLEKSLKEQIALVKFQIANHVDIEDAPSLDELENRLFHLESELERL